MNARVIPYEPEHAYMILDKMIEEENLELSKFPDWDKWVKTIKENGSAYTLFINDEIVGCAGVVLLGYGKGEAWMLRVASRLCKHKKTVYKIVKEMLPMIVKGNDLKRLQALVMPNFDAGSRFLRHLGFEEEGTLHSYGPNEEDMTIFWRKC